MLWQSLKRKNNDQGPGDKERKGERMKEREEGREDERKGGRHLCIIEIFILLISNE